MMKSDNIIGVLIISLLMFLLQSCEKVDSPELAEDNFLGLWEEHDVFTSGGQDTAFVSMDSIMSLVANGYHFYLVDGFQNEMTWITQNTTRGEIENMIQYFFSSPAIEIKRDTILDLIEFQKINNEYIVRSQQFRSFNDRPFRVYKSPSGEVALQSFDKVANSWEALFSSCFLVSLDEGKKFYYPCDRVESGFYRLELQAFTPNRTSSFKLWSLDAKEVNDKYYSFVR